MTSVGVRNGFLLAATLGLLAVPAFNVARGFAGLGHPPLQDVASVFLAAAALSFLAPRSAALVRAFIASGVAFIMHAILMTFWYSADSEALAWVVWILGLPASLLLGGLIGIGSWLETNRARHPKS